MLLGLQILTGLFAVDLERLGSVPLSYLIDFYQGRVAAQIHEVTFNALLAASALHDLGDRVLPTGQAPQSDRCDGHRPPARRWRSDGACSGVATGRGDRRGTGGYLRGVH